VSMFPKEMWRAIAPQLAVASILMLIAMIVYEHGAPAWVIHLAAICGALVVLPGYIRWDKRYYGD
jgi:hypothetical protein